MANGVHGSGACDDRLPGHPFAFQQCRAALNLEQRAPQPPVAVATEVLSAVLVTSRVASCRRGKFRMRSL